jgi:hypothetical protein
MFQIDERDYASATTRQRIEEHNAAVDQLGIDQAAAKRAAEDLAVLDVMTSDPEQTETATRKLRIQRHANVKTAIALLQDRLPIIEALREDWQRAKQDAESSLQRARGEVIEGLRALGFAPWLDCGDLVAQQQAATLIDFASGPAALLQRLESLRDDHKSLMELTTETNQEIRTLTENLRKTVREAAALV